MSLLHEVARVTHSGHGPVATLLLRNVKNWAHKYLEQIPAVVVLFVDLNWNHPSWNEKKFECQSKVNSLR